MSRLPIRVRLTAAFVVLMAVVLVLLGLFVTQRLRSDLTSEVDRSLTAAAAQIAEGYTEEGLVGFDEATREAVATPGARTLGAQLVAFGGGPVTRSAGSDLLTAQLPSIEGLTLSPSAGATAMESLRVGPDRVHIRARAIPAIVDGRRGALVVAEPLDEVDDAVRRTRILLLVGGAITLALAGLVAWSVIDRAMRPVRRMTMRAEAIDIRELDQRVPVPPARDELNHLARTFNAMLERLRQGVESRERLIADASHELRAPLAAMRAELDVSLRHDGLDNQSRAVLESVRDEATRMSRIVDNLLALARIDEGKLDLLMSPHDLNEIAKRSVRTHTARLDAAGLRFEAGGVPITIACDGDRITQVVDNLVDNAIRHSPPGGLVRVIVGSQNGHATLEVQDEGPGVPDEHRERIFERFARVDAARGRDGGAGLGLALSREIVHAHGGRIELASSNGNGSTFTITLPTAHDPDSQTGSPNSP